MKITGTRSYIMVEFTEGAFKNKRVKIEGELTLIPAFYATKSTIRNWEAPYTDVEITDNDKQQIVDQILKHNNPSFEIIFED